MNQFTKHTLNFYFTELYKAHKMNDFDTADLFHTKISAYTIAMIDLGVDFDVCDTFCSEANRVFLSML